ncbi:DUF4199 domain-containing protein [Sunxiuqinia elliptica]|uniref:DUF4199 domain-containing protein n=1 Tax=Sunxiuqinia elliptica TaxID=655355 RepID=A0A1I2IDH5_9BACT|nr:DUF4199 domain-containing protein [Sunxiuqinia elliptica]SFF38896.1 Protein of unknown function [Sunxiuqinia elliptica]
MEQKSTFWKSAMTLGLYLAIALILYNVVLYVLGENMNKTLGLITYVIMGAGIYWCQLNYRNNELGGYIEYSKALGFGVAVMLFAGVLNALYTVILLKVDPSIMEQVRIMQEEAMLQQGMSEEQIEMAGEMMSKFQSPIVIVISSLFTFAFIGFLISLVTSIFIKRKQEEDAFEEAMDEIKAED